MVKLTGEQVERAAIEIYSRILGPGWDRISEADRSFYRKRVIGIAQLVQAPIEEPTDEEVARFWDVYVAGASGDCRASVRSGLQDFIDTRNRALLEPETTPFESWWKLNCKDCNERTKQVAQIAWEAGQNAIDLTEGEPHPAAGTVA